MNPLNVDTAIVVFLVAVCLVAGLIVSNRRDGRDENKEGWNCFITETPKAFIKSCQKVVRIKK